MIRAGSTIIFVYGKITTAVFMVLSFLRLIFTPNNLGWIKKLHAVFKGGGEGERGTGVSGENLLGLVRHRASKLNSSKITSNLASSIGEKQAFDH